MHDGSHYAHDDPYVSIDDSIVENYLKVFREIFVKARHIEHCKMMMRYAFVEKAGQTVFHLHLHILGGRPLHWSPG